MTVTRIVKKFLAFSANQSSITGLTIACHLTTLRQCLRCRQPDYRTKTDSPTRSMTLLNGHNQRYYDSINKHPNVINMEKKTTQIPSLE